eukprot:TRINITY_DN728_c0_g1_i2.p1 TRINITY_DN728_c0_g1~~TRINITY_DN728_c0_g1_i2.p1  ORF type:complete len:974 (-),score=205.67 TRINITY_DN728_c0_g1_i2:27-2948(-)
MRVILSDANTPGEGEHKIFQFIKSYIQETGYDDNTKHVFFGNDADIILLGLGIHVQNFTILRWNPPQSPTSSSVNRGGDNNNSESGRSNSSPAHQNSKVSTISDIKSSPSEKKNNTIRPNRPNRSKGKKRKNYTQRHYRLVYVGNLPTTITDPTQLDELIDNSIRAHILQIKLYSERKSAHAFIEMDSSEKAQELCFKLNGSLIMGKMIIVDRAPAPPKEKFSFVKTDDVEDNNYRTSKVAPSVSLTLKSRNSSGADNEENDSVTDDTEDDGDDGTVDNEENDTDGAHEETINTTTTTPVEESDSNDSSNTNEQSNDSSEVINPSSSPSTESAPPSSDDTNANANNANTNPIANTTNTTTTRVKKLTSYAGTFFTLKMFKLRQCLENEFSTLKSKMEERHVGSGEGNGGVGFKYDFENVLNDFILLSYLAGNDFLPCLPGADISNGTLEFFIEIYKQRLPSYGTYLTSLNKINIRAFLQFLKDYSEIEPKIFKRNWLIYQQKKLAKLKKEKNQQDTGPDTSSRDQFYESLRRFQVEEGIGQQVNNFLILDQLDENDVPIQLQLKSGMVINDVAIIDTTESVKLHLPSFNERYYDINFGNTDEKFIESVCIDYLVGLSWTFSYYVGPLPSWSWYYGHHFAPLAVDIRNLDIDKVTKSVENMFEKITEPLEPFQQLLAVMPPTSYKALPKPISHLVMQDSPLSEYYPSKFTVNMNGNELLWKGVVILSFIDEEVLKDVYNTTIQDVTWTEYDLERNERRFARLFYYTSDTDDEKENLLDILPVSKLPVPRCIHALQLKDSPLNPEQLFQAYNNKTSRSEEESNSVPNAWVKYQRTKFVSPGKKKPQSRNYKKVKAFSGQGHSVLGSQIGTAASLTSQISSSVSEPPPPLPLPVIDCGLPTAKISVKGLDGKSVVVVLNTNHTVKDLYDCVRNMFPNSPQHFSLLMTYPRKTLTDMNSSISESKLANAAVIQTKIT